MKNQVIAKRYSRALFNLAQEEKAIEQYGTELEGFSQALRAIPDLDNALRDPLCPGAIKRSLIQKVTSQLELSPVMKSFLALLVEKNRMRYLSEIAEYYNKLIDDYSNIARAKVKAAIKLGNAEINEISAALEKKFEKKIVVQFEQDSSLIGGVFAQIGDVVLDGSVKRQLLNFKESLKRGAVG